MNVAALPSQVMRSFLTGVLILAVAQAIHAELRLPRIFSDNLVLQAGRPTTCWGWGDPGAKISITFISVQKDCGFECAGTVGMDHHWIIRLPPVTTGVAGSLDIISSSGEKKLVTNVIAGEVWLASGQSNMAYLLSAENAPPRIMSTAKDEAAEVRPAVRFFMTDRKGADLPLDDVAGSWVVASPENVGKCSAVAWNFAVTVHRELKSPVGLIVSSVGGTPAEAWISRAALDATSVGVAILSRHRAALAESSPERIQEYNARESAWVAANQTLEQKRANQATRPREPYSPSNNHAPSRYYNAMVHGLAPYEVRGVLWFQGDANAEHPNEYGELIRTLITAWREQWHAEIPFFYVELNNMGKPQQNPVEIQSVSLIREAQGAALALPRTGVVSAIDLGEEQVHFPNKKPVGERLARLALVDVYGCHGLARSPEYLRSEFLPDGKVRIILRNGAGLRTTGGGEARGFAVRGVNGPWFWATATIEGETALIWNGQVSKPAAVRYGWARNPVTSIVNEASLPLRPFRTDQESPK